MPEGELKKLKMIGYTDSEFKNKADSGEFTTLVNPEKYNLSYKIEYDDQQGQGSSSVPAKFTKIKPQDFEIEFLFDSTGVIAPPNGSSGSVQDELDKFRSIAFTYNGDEHRPNFIKLVWGSLLFKGVLMSMDVEYKLFKPSGEPIRATAKCSFKGHQDDEERAAEEKKSSPDLTHVRQVKAGDTLPLMTHRIYGDSKYYLEVAKYNKLSNFRKLTPGQQIVFPPIEKQS
ncbi:MAG: LysM peptidoglycan-binding domain-containing protein [bacterium]|nr:LysM peptidoglycan-binding domain-containing protein [bacterium]